MNSLRTSRRIVITGAGVPLAGDTDGQREAAFGAAWFAVSGAGQRLSRPASKPGGGGLH